MSTIKTYNIDVSALPIPSIVEPLSIEAIIAARKARLLELHPECADVLALESEPLVKLLEATAYREFLLRARYNEEALALTISYATGSDLDHIGVTYYREPRFELQAEDLSVSPPKPQVMESDEDYRQRLLLKPASYSVAGPTDAYRFHALSASADVLDANPVTPRPGTTTTVILSRSNGGVPAAATLAAVEARLNTEDVRPLCEESLVVAATVVSYTAHVEIWTYPGVDATAKQAEAQAAVQMLTRGYSISADGAEVRGELFAIGLDHPLSRIEKAAQVSGVQRAKCTLPAQDVVCDGYTAAYCSAVTVDWMGVAQ